MVLSKRKLKEQKLREKTLAAEQAGCNTQDAVSEQKPSLNGNADPVNSGSKKKSENRRKKEHLRRQQRKEALRQKRRKTEHGNGETGEVINSVNIYQGEEFEEEKEGGGVSDEGDIEMNLVSSKPKATKPKPKKRKKSEKESSMDGVVVGSSAVATNGETNGNALKKRQKREKESSMDGVVVGSSAVVTNLETNGNASTATNHSQNDSDSGDGKTVYVGGIPYYSTEEDIRDFFRECGTISNLVCKTFPDSGKFRGIAILTFKTEEAAKRALGFDETSMGNTFLKVMPYVSKHKEVPKKKAHTEAPSKVQGYTRAYIGNLSWDVTEENIRELFKDCNIESIRFSLDKTTGEFQGFGHVDFADDQSLELAIKLDQEDLLGRPIKIAYAVPKKNQQAPNSGKTLNNKDKSCYSCGEKGHFSSQCVNKPK